MNIPEHVKTIRVCELTASSHKILGGHIERWQDDPEMWDVYNAADELQDNITGNPGFLSEQALINLFYSAWGPDDTYTLRVPAEVTSLHLTDMAPEHNIVGHIKRLPKSHMWRLYKMTGTGPGLILGGVNEIALTLPDALERLFSLAWTNTTEYALMPDTGA